MHRCRAGTDRARLEQPGALGVAAAARVGHARTLAVPGLPLRVSGHTHTNTYTGLRRSLPALWCLSDGPVVALPLLRRPVLMAAGQVKLVGARLDEGKRAT